MAVESDVIGLIAYDGDGIVTDLVVTFLFSVPEDLVVVDTVVATGVETTLTYITDYTVTGGGGNPGVPTTGTVVMNVAPAAGHRTTIKRDLPILQPLTLVPNTALPSASLMYVLDRQTLMIQDQFENFTRALSSTVGSNLSDLQISSLTTSAILQVNAVDNTIIGSITLSDLATALGVAAGSNSFGTIVVSGQSDVIADQASDTLTLVAGSNMTITTNATTDAITFAAAGGNSFGTFSVSGQSDVVADTTNDTLTLVAGTHITIATNASTDSITINATDSGTTLVSVTQSSHGFSVGHVLYLVGSTYTKAIATSVAAAEVVGVVSAVADSNNFSLTTSGRVTGLTSLTAGTVYFLDSSVAGTVSSTQQTTVGNIDKPVYVADSTTSVILIPYRGVIVGNTISAAAQSDITTATSTTTYVTPSVQKYIPGAAKAWARVTQSAGAYTLTTGGLNVASATKNSTGNITVTFTTSMADANYGVQITTDLTATSAYYTSAATGSVVVNIKSVGTTPTATDAGFSITIWGTL